LADETLIELALGRLIVALVRLCPVGRPLKSVLDIIAVF